MVEEIDIIGPLAEFETAFFGFSAAAFNDSVFNVVLASWEAVVTEEMGKNHLFKNLSRDDRSAFISFPFQDDSLKKMFKRFESFCASTLFRIPPSVVLDEHMKMHESLQAMKNEVLDLNELHQEYNKLLEKFLERRAKLAKISGELEEINSAIDVLYELKKAEEQLSSENLPAAGDVRDSPI